MITPQRPHLATRKTAVDRWPTRSVAIDRYRLVPHVHALLVVLLAVSGFANTTRADLSVTGLTPIAQSQMFSFHSPAIAASQSAQLNNLIAELKKIEKRQAADLKKHQRLDAKIRAAERSLGELKIEYRKLTDANKLLQQRIAQLKTEKIF